MACIHARTVIVELRTYNVDIIRQVISLSENISLNDNEIDNEISKSNKGSYLSHNHMVNHVLVVSCFVLKRSS